VDIYFDIEGLPDRNFHYLLGLVIHDEEKVSHHAFWADNKDQEMMIFQQFLALLRQYPAFTLFHYGSYEAKYLQKMRQALREETESYLEKIYTVVVIYSPFSIHIFIFPPIPMDSKRSGTS
jgi:predicted RecB family nuclease